MSYFVVLKNSTGELTTDSANTVLSEMATVYSELRDLYNGTRHYLSQHAQDRIDSLVRGIESFGPDLLQEKISDELITKYHEFPNALFEITKEEIAEIETIGFDSQ